MASYEMLDVYAPLLPFILRFFRVFKNKVLWKMYLSKTEEGRQGKLLSKEGRSL